MITSNTHSPSLSVFLTQTRKHTPCGRGGGLASASSRHTSLLFFPSSSLFSKVFLHKPFISQCPDFLRLFSQLALVSSSKARRLNRVKVSSSVFCVANSSFPSPFLSSFLSTPPSPLSVHLVCCLFASEMRTSCQAEC